MPALAVADALRARGAQIEFVGADRAEAQLVPAAGYPLHRLSVRGLHRSNPLRALQALALALAAIPRAR
ncbi:MAG TPA: glycosyltransferase, partial [Solirubrobacteraceae bacterium]|nr:glycosyltransferase [Solirubrobacteraceae bacterium]